MGWSCFAKPRKFITKSTARQPDSRCSLGSKAPMRGLKCRDGIVMRWAQSNQRHNREEKKNPSHQHISTGVEDKSDTEHGIESSRTLPDETGESTRWREMKSCKSTKRSTARDTVRWLELTVVCLLSYELVSFVSHLQSANGPQSYAATLLPTAEGTLIIGDSAFEVQEIHHSHDVQHDPLLRLPLEDTHHSDHNKQLPNHHQLQHQPYRSHEGSFLGHQETVHLQPLEEPVAIRKLEASRHQAKPLVASPLPPLGGGPLISESRNVALEDITDGDKSSRASHDYEIKDTKQVDREKDLTKVIPAILPSSLVQEQPEENLDKSASDPAANNKAIAGKIVDYELESAGGHNKAKIKKKQKKMKEAEEFKKWGHKKSAEKKAVDMMHKQAEKKKKSEGHKGKKKWGKEVHGHKKKGNFKKNKWGKKIKKGHGLKKGKKGKKFLKDVGHKNTGFKTVYHKEEWGKSSKWHDIDRQKKWDEKSKKWNKKWKKEKGKKYKGNHMKKFEKKKKSGKKYSKKHEDKFKKYKKEEFEKGKKKKMEQKSKKKEGGSKKAAELMKKKKKKGMY